jgi:hypothetical protein
LLLLIKAWNDEIKEDEIEGSCITFERDEACFQTLSGNSDGKITYERLLHIWKGNIKMDYQEESKRIRTGLHRFRMGTSHRLLGTQQ